MSTEITPQPQEPTGIVKASPSVKQLPVAGAVAIGSSFVLLTSFAWMRYAMELIGSPAGNPEYIKLAFEAWKVVGGIAGFTLAVFLAYFTYVRSRVLEENLKVTTESNEAAQIRHEEQLAQTRNSNLNERFFKASELLAHESSNVRMSGVYALAKIGIEDPETYRDTVINILSGFFNDQADKFRASFLKKT